MVMSLDTFFKQFINNTYKQKSYGNYYIVNGNNVDILMSKQPGAPSNDNISVVLMRFKNGVPVIIFNHEGVKSLRREDRQKFNAMITGVSFNFPKIWNVSQDLLSLRVEDINENGDVLISGSFGKFSFCGIPSDKPISKKDFLSAPTSRKVVYHVPSTITKAGREGIMFEGFDTFLDGVWIKALGVVHIEEFLPKAEDCEKYFNPPNRKISLPIYEVFLGLAATEELISRDNYEYSTPITNTSGLTRICNTYKSLVTAYEASYKEWKKFAQNFAKTYVGFDRKIFHGSYQLVSQPLNPANYFADKSGREFVKGAFSSYYGKIVLEMPTWCEIKPVSRLCETL